MSLLSFTTIFFFTLWYMLSIALLILDASHMNLLLFPGFNQTLLISVLFLSSKEPGQWACVHKDH